MKAGGWKEVEVIVPLFGGTAICAYLFPQNWIIALILGFAVGSVSSAWMLSRAFKESDSDGSGRERKSRIQIRNLYYGAGVAAVIAGFWTAWKMQELLGKMWLAEPSYFGWGYMIAAVFVGLYFGRKISGDLKSAI